MLYPKFAECKQYTTDPYWLDVFDQCAIGKFPKGMRPTKDDNVIIYDLSGKGTKEVVRISSLGTKDMFLVLVGVFKNKLEMISDRDLEVQKKNFEDTEDSFLPSSYENWKQIKQKKVRNNLLINFVLEKQKEYNHTKIETNELLSLIRIGFIFKALTSNDVNFQKGKIQNIKGLTFDKQGKFFCNIYNGSTTKKSDIGLSTAVRIPIYFERYVKEYKSICIKI